MAGQNNASVNFRVDVSIEGGLCAFLVRYADRSHAETVQVVLDKVDQFRFDSELTVGNATSLSINSRAVRLILFPHPKPGFGNRLET